MSMPFHFIIELLTRYYVGIIDRPKVAFVKKYQYKCVHNEL